MTPQPATFDCPFRTGNARRLITRVFVSCGSRYMLSVPVVCPRDIIGPEILLGPAQPTAPPSPSIEDSGQ